MSKHVAQRIKEAFDKARQQPVETHIPKKPVSNGVYTEESARQFERRADQLIAEVLSDRLPSSSHKGPWYLGDLDAHLLPSAEQLIAQAAKVAPRPAEKLSFLNWRKMIRQR